MPASMRGEQRRQSPWASTDDDYTCATKAQCDQLRRGRNTAGSAINFGGDGLAGCNDRILSLFELDVDQATSFYEQRTIHAAEK